MRLLGSAPMSHLCDQKRSTVIGLSDLMTLFIDLGCLYCKQTQRAFNVFRNTLNWLKNWKSINRLKVLLTRVWELLTRLWNAWHWETHCVFTAGGERVKTLVQFSFKTSYIVHHRSLYNLAGGFFNKRIEGLSLVSASITPTLTQFGYAHFVNSRPLSTASLSAKA
jgi:hypothetical protein